MSTSCCSKTCSTASSHSNQLVQMTLSFPKLPRATEMMSTGLRAGSTQRRASHTTRIISAKQPRINRLLQNLAFWPCLSRLPQSVSPQCFSCSFAGTLQTSSFTPIGSKRRSTLIASRPFSRSSGLRKSAVGRKDLSQHQKIAAKWNSIESEPTLGYVIP